MTFLKQMSVLSSQVSDNTAQRRIADSRQLMPDNRYGPRAAWFHGKMRSGLILF
jgi:hypothetical protein